MKQKSWAKNPINLFILRKLKTVDRDAEATIYSIRKEGAYVSERRETALPKRPSRSIPNAQRQPGFNTPGLAGAASVSQGDAVELHVRSDTT